MDISVPSIEYEVRIEPGERINVYSLKCDSDAAVIFKVSHKIQIFQKTLTLSFHLSCNTHFTYRFRTIWELNGPARSS